MVNVTHLYFHQLGQVQMKLVLAENYVNTYLKYTEACGNGMSAKESQVKKSFQSPARERKRNTS